MKNLTYAISAIIVMLLIGTTIIIYATISLTNQNTKLIKENNRLTANCMDSGVSIARHYINTH